jgi:hypothetical protein
MRLSDIHLKYEDDFWDRCFADGRPFEEIAREGIVIFAGSDPEAARRLPVLPPGYIWEPVGGGVVVPGHPSYFFQVWRREWGYLLHWE